MAVYGLQIDFMNKLLMEYFGGKPDLSQKELFIGLGLTQIGARVNTDDFDEVFGGRPLGNYQRARVIFGKAADGYILNANEIVFNTASEDWTDSNAQRYVEMIGIFNTMEYENIKPLIVLRLPKSEEVLKGETCVFGTGTIQLSLSDY